MSAAVTVKSKGVVGFCIQFDGDESDAQLWFDDSQGFMMFLMATHCADSVASCLQGIEPMKREIYSYLVDKRNIVGQGFCTRVLCMFPRCPHSICIEHGWGDGVHEGGGDMSFDERRCIDCESYYCWKH
jgi:hypothetical protein